MVLGIIARHDIVWRELAMSPRQWAFIAEETGARWASLSQSRLATFNAASAVPDFDCDYQRLVDADDLRVTWAFADVPSGRPAVLLAEQGS